MQIKPLISRRLTLAITACALSFAAHSAAPPEAAVCFGCHGSTGQGVAGVAPKLSGLSSEYIASQIALFKNGSRQNAQMQPMAMTLTSDKATKMVAEYFAQQPVSQPKLQVRGEKVIINDDAEKLSYQGDWSRNIPACTTCHGPSGVGAGPFPRLAGQQQKYLADQLIAWQKGTRSGDPDNVMGNIAQKLTADEIQHLAQYFSALN
jgi:cytochrome c553